MNIVNGDQVFLLLLLQKKKSIAMVNLSFNMEILLTLSQVDFSDVVDPMYIQCVSFHTACNVHPLDTSIHLLWSHYGVQGVVGWSFLYFQPQRNS